MYEATSQAKNEKCRGYQPCRINNNTVARAASRRAACVRALQQLLVLQSGHFPWLSQQLVLPRVIDTVVLASSIRRVFLLNNMYVHNHVFHMARKNTIPTSV